MKDWSGDIVRTNDIDSETVSVRDYVMREVESRRTVVPGISRRNFSIPVYKALTYDYGTLRVCSLAPITTSSLPGLPRTNCAPFPRISPARCPIEKNNRNAKRLVQTSDCAYKTQRKYSVEVKISLPAPPPSTTPASSRVAKSCSVVTPCLKRRAQ